MSQALDRTQDHVRQTDQNGQQNPEHGATSKMQTEVQGLMISALNTCWNDPLGAGRAELKEHKPDSKEVSRENAFNTLGMMDIYGKGKGGDAAAGEAINQEMRQRADIAFDNRVNGKNEDNPSHSGFRNFRDTNVAELNFNNNPHLNTQGRPLAFAS